MSITRKIVNIEKRPPASSFNWDKTVDDHENGFSFWGLPRYSPLNEGSSEQTVLISDGSSWSFMNNKEDTCTKRSTAEYARPINIEATKPRDKESDITVVIRRPTKIQ